MSALRTEGHRSRTRQNPIVPVFPNRWFSGQVSHGGSLTLSCKEPLRTSDEQRRRDRCISSPRALSGSARLATASSHECPRFAAYRRHAFITPQVETRQAISLACAVLAQPPWPFSTPRASPAASVDGSHDALGSSTRSHSPSTEVARKAIRSQSSLSSTIGAKRCLVVYEHASKNSLLRLLEIKHDCISSNPPLRC